jgi:methylated-DNA-[protein]-cysteine S-methyltransferase
MRRLAPHPSEASTNATVAARRTDIPPERITSDLAQARVVFVEPLGALWLVWSPRGLVQVRWDSDGPLPDLPTRRAPSAVVTPLRAFAKGADVDPAQEIEVDLVGTEFQKKVWRALLRVPRGRVRTYSGIAADVGSPRAMRAVGTANGVNPLPIVVPCHRIVGAGHTLGGYSGGLDRKRSLLQHEGVKLDRDHLLPGQLALF